MAKIFQELQGNYGSRFLNQWKTGQILEDGRDAGMVNAMAMWGAKLAGYATQPERIRHALDHLPSDPPSLPDFIAMCNRAPDKVAPRLDYKPTPEELERAKAAANAAAAVVKKARGFDPLNCWRRPASHKAVEYLLDGARKDRQLAVIRDDLIEQGVITAEGRANKLWRNDQWVAV